MELSDCMQIYAAYMGAFTGLFAVAYGSDSLWEFFKALAKPDFKTD